MYPITLGANIGTTCTGLLASLVTGKINALQIAFCHLSFNVFGVLLLYPIKCIRDIPLDLAKFYGKIARKYKWFPLIHIVGTFIISPLIILGISLLFELNTIGIIFGSVICLLIVMIITKYLYWYYLQDGEKKLIKKLEIIENNP